MDVVLIGFQLFNQPIMIGRHGTYGFFDGALNIKVPEYFPTVFGTKDQMIEDGIPSVSARAIAFIHVPFSIPCSVVICPRPRRGGEIILLYTLREPFSSGNWTNESVPPPPRRASADTKEKCSLLFGFARDQFLLKRKGHFSLAFCPPSIRAGGGTNADSVLRKLFFGERVSQNPRLIFFEFGSRKRRRRGLGRNPPLAPLFSFGEFLAGNTKNPLANLICLKFWCNIIVVIDKWILHYNVNLLLKICQQAKI